jgi:hypothetical protein
MSDLTTSELDTLLVNIVAARKAHDEAKEKASEAYEVRQRLEKELTEKLIAAGKAQWRVDGVGLASIVDSTSVQTPKTAEERKALFEYIKTTYGEEAAFTKFSINAQTLNGFYKAELEAAQDASLFSLPGVGEPVSTKEFRFRKS